MKSNSAQTYLTGIVCCLLLVLVGVVTALGAETNREGASDGWESGDLPLAGFTVQVTLDYTDDFHWSALAEALIGLYLKPGQPLTLENLTAAEQAVAPFGRVGSRVVVVGQQARVAFSFAPYKRIRSIAIKGNYPLFERQVRGVMQVGVGDLFRPEDMALEKERIVDLYKASGYVDPQVEFSGQADARDPYEQVRITIEEGPYYTLKDLRIKGLSGLDEVAVKAGLSVWRKSLVGNAVRFEPAELKKEVDNLIADHRRMGYYDVQVTAQTDLDPRNRDARVTLTIEDGPQYTLAFEGNHFFGDKTLSAELVMESIGNQGNKGVRRSVLAIRRHYLDAGFPDVNVAWKDLSAASDDRTRPIVFVVDEGQRRIVNSLAIQGNHYLDQDLIREQILTRPPAWFYDGPFVEEVLAQDEAAVRALYLQHGFLSTQVTHDLQPDNATGSVDVVLRIDEGVRTRVGAVTVLGEAPISQDEILKMGRTTGMQPGEPFRPYMIQEAENVISARIAALGYPYVQVKGTPTVSEDETRADISYKIDSGPLVRVGEIFLAGNFRTRDSYIKNELGLEKGGIFSLEEVLDAQRNVRNLSLFDTVNLNTIGLKQKADTVPLLITVAEKKAYFVELGGGYQSDKGVYQRFKIGDNNLAGSGKEIWLGGEISQTGYRWDAGFREPRLLGIRLGLDAGVFTEREEPFNQDTGTEKTGGTIGLSRNWGQFFTTRLGLRYERRQQFLLDDGGTVEDPETLKPRTVIVTTPAVTYDDRDSFILPRKGLLASLAVDISRGIDNELDDYLKYRFDARWFKPLNEKLILASRLGVGFLHLYGETDELPQDQLFYLGGTTTVRGFDESLLRYVDKDTAVGGQLAIWGSIEGRYRYWNNWELAVFVDTGNLSETIDDFSGDDFRWSAGLGMEYITPIGPIGLFYGHKLNPREGESPGQWHFSIGYTF